MGYTGSMEPTFRGGDAIDIVPTPIEDVVVGDVIDTYWDGIGKNVGHRVIAIRVVNGEIGLVTKGDANQVRDDMVTTRANYNGVIVKR